MFSILEAAVMNIDELEAHPIYSQLRNLGTSAMVWMSAQKDYFLDDVIIIFFKEPARQVQRGIIYENASVNLIHFLDLVT